METPSGYDQPGNERDPEPLAIRPRTEHPISRRMIDPDALTVLYRLKNAGFTAYLVGGAVRDLLMGRTPKDFDVSTNAHPRDLKRLFRNCFLVGKRFRLAHIRFGQKVIETSTFRREPPPEAAHVAGDTRLHHRDNTFGTPAEDAYRRDFTINGLFYDIRTFSIIDYVGGLADIEKRLLRCIGDPDVRYPEDPVRMLRAIRFATRFHLDIETGTYLAMGRHCGEIEKVSKSRLIEEVYRLFSPGSTRSTFAALHETGLLKHLMPEFTRWVDSDPVPATEAWSHLAALDAVQWGEALWKPDLFLGALFAPLVRARVQTLGPNPKAGAVMDVTAGVLRPFFERYQAPRAIYYNLIHVFGNLSRIERERNPSAARHLLAQEWLPLALALLEISLKASGHDPAPTVTAWEEARQRLPPGAHVPVRRGRRRRPGRRRGEGHARAGETGDRNQSGNESPGFGTTT